MSRREAEVLFGDWLINKDLLSPEGLETALAEQQRSGGRLGEVLFKLRILDEQQVVSALSDFLSFEKLSFDDPSIIDMEVARSIPETVAKRHGLLAVHGSDDAVLVAMVDPLDIVAKDDVRLRLGRRIDVAISSATEIDKAIEMVYHGSMVQEERIRDLVDVMVSTEDADILPEIEDDGISADISSEAAANKAPVIRFVDLMLSQAVRSRASDIHIEPQEQTMTIRMRVDGMLRDMIAPTRRMQPAVTARVKILSGMDIAERRLRQDGRFQVKAPGRDIDIRVSTIPTIYGEKVVMRILDKEAVNHDIEQLGFEPELLTEFKSALAQPHGIIIVTGPTGSGKSTTLYSALNFLVDPRKNITTVEDPVEYRLNGVNQMQIKPDIGLAFAECLRAILRQDPDIILIGEIRDRETIEIAIQASLTGHLVLSTFHTNDAPSAVSRLSYMGLERYLVASTLNLVIAQRLVRRICEHCKQPTELNESVLRRLGITPQRAAESTFCHGVGCNACEGTGYLGRLPVFEFLPMDDDIRDSVTDGASEAKIRAMGRTRGYGGLLESGTRRLMEGLTTAEEVLRVTFARDGGPATSGESGEPLDCSAEDRRT
jgi:type IV pilus assembly protein PilB